MVPGPWSNGPRALVQWPQGPGPTRMQPYRGYSYPGPAISWLFLPRASHTVTILAPGQPYRDYFLNFPIIFPPFPPIPPRGPTIINIQQSTIQCRTVGPWPQGRARRLLTLGLEKDCISDAEEARLPGLPALAWLACLLCLALAWSGLGLSCLPCLGLVQQQQPAAFGGRRRLRRRCCCCWQGRQDRPRPDQAKAGHNRQASQAKAGDFGGSGSQFSVTLNYLSF